MIRISLVLNSKFIKFKIKNKNYIVKRDSFNVFIKYNGLICLKEEDYGVFKRIHKGRE